MAIITKQITEAVAKVSSLQDEWTSFQHRMVQARGNAFTPLLVPYSKVTKQFSLCSRVWPFHGKQGVNLTADYRDEDVDKLTLRLSFLGENIFRPRHHEIISERNT